MVLVRAAARGCSKGATNKDSGRQIVDHHRGTGTAEKWLESGVEPVAPPTCLPKHQVL